VTDFARQFPAREAPADLIRQLLAETRFRRRIERLVTGDDKRRRDGVITGQPVGRDTGQGRVHCLHIPLGLEVGRPGDWE